MATEANRGVPRVGPQNSLRSLSHREPECDSAPPGGLHGAVSAPRKANGSCKNPWWLMSFFLKKKNKSLYSESISTSRAGAEKSPSSERRRHFSHPRWGDLGRLLPAGPRGARLPLVLCSGLLSPGRCLHRASTALQPGCPGPSQGGGRQLPHPPLRQDG